MAEGPRHRDNNRHNNFAEVHTERARLRVLRPGRRFIEKERSLRNGDLSSNLVLSPQSLRTINYVLSLSEKYREMEIG